LNWVPIGKAASILTLLHVTVISDGPTGVTAQLRVAHTTWKKFHLYHPPFLICTSYYTHCS
jgi:hypothetical protein